MEEPVFFSLGHYCQISDHVSKFEVKYFLKEFPTAALKSVIGMPGDRLLVFVHIFPELISFFKPPIKAYSNLWTKIFCKPIMSYCKMKLKTKMKNKNAL